jgi:ABC-type multidrug transport system permease subunit
MSTLLTIIRKDLRLLWRDRAGLIFLTVAPIMVITVAGFSLSNLYGADPTGQTAYELPFVDEDAGSLGENILTRLARERAVDVHPVASRAEAQRLVEHKRAGAALVIPRGTQADLDAGRPAKLILYIDSVKYLERLNVRTRLLEMRERLTADRREQVARDLAAQREQLADELQHLRATLASARAELDHTWTEAQRRRDQTVAKMREQVAETQRKAAAQLRRMLAAFTQDATQQMQAQTAAVSAPARAYLESLTAARAQFEQWLGQLKHLAGSHAGDIPPPPRLPEIPPELARLAAGDHPPWHLPAPPPIDFAGAQILPPELPPLPALPSLALPEITLPEPPPPPASLAIEEVNVSGGPATVNTFDQNVPGFSVTFLLLGMLLGVSLGLLDERDWGTFDRLRAMPTTAATILVGKLISRFVVGMIQMVALFTVGWLAFGISLGPQPWALALPTAGIVFAGTAFGLIVAAVATSREAVLPVGSIVIVTMAAVGGCWWPIDLEPRWMRTVALAFPTTWAMDAFNDLMIRRRTVDAALLPTAVMLAYGFAYLMIGVVLFGRQVRRRGR